MSTWLVIAVACAYVWTAYEQFHIGNLGYAIMFLSYSVANAGLLIQVLKR